MTVKPDVMDGVPDKTGYYLYKEDVFEAWRACEVYLSVGGLRIRSDTALGGLDGVLLNEIKDDNYLFSERIQPPEVE